MTNYFVYSTVAWLCNYCLWHHNGNFCRRMLTLFELFCAVFLFVWCGTAFPHLIFSTTLLILNNFRARWVSYKTLKWVAKIPKVPSFVFSVSACAWAKSTWHHGNLCPPSVYVLYFKMTVLHQLSTAGLHLITFIVDFREAAMCSFRDSQITDCWLLSYLVTSRTLSARNLRRLGFPWVHVVADGNLSQRHQLAQLYTTGRLVRLGTARRKLFGAFFSGVFKFLVVDFAYWLTFVNQCVSPFDCRLIYPHIMGVCWCQYCGPLTAMLGTWPTCVECECIERASLNYTLFWFFALIDLLRRY